MYLLLFYIDIINRDFEDKELIKCIAILVY